MINSIKREKSTTEIVELAATARLKRSMRMTMKKTIVKNTRSGIQQRKGEKIRMSINKSK